jgi:hypothetical protein
MTTWQLLTTAPNAEMRIERMMRCLSFDNHLFKTRRRIFCHGKVEERLFPYFPGYIFVQAKNKTWFDVRTISGVIDFVRFDGMVVDIAQKEIDRLLNMADAEKVIRLPDSSRFRMGDKVRVAGMHNLMFGAIGIYQYAIGLDKAFVLLPWFNGRMTGTAVHECDLEYVYNNRTRKRHRNRRRRLRERTLLVEKSSSVN